MEIAFHCTDEINLNVFLIYVFQQLCIKYLALMHIMYSYFCYPYVYLIYVITVIYTMVQQNIFVHLTSGTKGYVNL
jgi:hypothetical protein